MANSTSEFKFENCVGFDNSMKEFAQMTILLALKQYPKDDHEKCLLVIKHFEERYGGYWSCSFIKDGDCANHCLNYYVKIKYYNYTIKITKTN